jgi:benzoyl-CoA reductase/2-hydroxyglutaryl-CoA dehydratase subunit BcrC/BadD/HgdB
MSSNWGQIVAEANPDRDLFRLTAGIRLMESPSALRLMRWVTKHNPRLPARQRWSGAFAFDLIRRLYAGCPDRVVWASVLTPPELLWGLDLTPFYPELGVSAVSMLGATPRSLETAASAGCPVDLCTFHRSGLGLSRETLFPPSAAFVATSNLCGLAGIMLAAEAHRQHKRFTLIDVPPTCDSAALDYVEAQLKALIGSLEEAASTHHDPERIRQAVRRSNQARALALELNHLRTSRPAPIRGEQMLRLSGLAFWLLGHPDGVAHFQAWRDYTADRVNRRDPEQPNQRIRLLWLHVGPHVESGLISHLENDLGAAVVFDEHNTFWWDELDEDRPLRSLAAKILTHPSNGPVERRLSLILDLIARYECDGVVHFSHWGCRQSAGAARVIRDQLRREGLPMLDLDGDCLDSTNTPTGPLRTRIEAFVETLT